MVVAGKNCELFKLEKKCQPHALINCSINCKMYPFVVGYFYFSLNIEGKGKRDQHIISQLFSPDPSD